jgi:NTP pyrophosphatase (non-canonical NTP hydrolase)
VTKYEPTQGEVRALAAIMAERARQDEKFGDQSAHSPVEWISILTEEVGEAAREANDLHFSPASYLFEITAPGVTRNPERDAIRERLRAEVVQLTAVGLAWLGHQYGGAQ